MNVDVIFMHDLAFISGAPGTGELIVLFIIILLLFGPKKLPSIARSVGKTIDELRKASNDFKDQIMKIDEHPSVDVPAEEISEDEPFEYGPDDGFDEFDMHMGEEDTDESDADVSGGTDDQKQDKSESPDASDEPVAGSVGEDSKKDDNAG